MISRGNDCLLVELLTKRYYNCEAFKRTMKKIWLPVKAMRFRELESEILMAEFENIKHKEWVVRDRPWNFDRNLVLLKDFDVTQQVKNIHINETVF